MSPFVWEQNSPSGTKALAYLRLQVGLQAALQAVTCHIRSHWGSPSQTPCPSSLSSDPSGPLFHFLLLCSVGPLATLSCLHYSQPAGDFVHPSGSAPRTAEAVQSLTLPAAGLAWPRVLWGQVPGGSGKRTHHKWGGLRVWGSCACNPPLHLSYLPKGSWVLLVPSRKHTV